MSDENRKLIDNLKIIEVYEPMYGRGHAKIGVFKRKAKGREYSQPRILLRSYFNKYIGKECKILEGKASFGNVLTLQNKDVLIIFLK